MHDAIRTAIGYAWIFENAIVFGDVHDFLTMINRKNRTSQKRFGDFKDVVIAEIPVDRFRILYYYYKDTPEWLAKKKMRDFLKSHGHKISNLYYRGGKHPKGQRRLTSFLRVKSAPDTSRCKNGTEKICR